MEPAVPYTVARRNHLYRVMYKHRVWCALLIALLRFLIAPKHLSSATSYTKEIYHAAEIPRSRLSGRK